MKNNLVLIGFMGSGKSTVGKKLAKNLNMKFVDIDDYIEKKENRSVNNIFEENGEDYFRAIESKCIKEIAQMNNTIIATGGGIINILGNIIALKKKGFVIYLNCSVDCIYNRVSKRSSRPLLNNIENLKGYITALLGDRDPIYTKYMDDEVHINSKTNLINTVERIEKLYIASD